MAGMPHGHSDPGAHYADFAPKETTVHEARQQAVTVRVCAAYSSPGDSTALPAPDAVLQS